MTDEQQAFDEVELIDEDGRSYVFVIEDVLEIDGRRYAVLTPKDDPDEGIVIFRIEKENGEDILVSIDDDEAEEVLALLE